MWVFENTLTDQIGSPTARKPDGWMVRATGLSLSSRTQFFTIEKEERKGKFLVSPVLIEEIGDDEIFTGIDYSSGCTVTIDKLNSKDFENDNYEEMREVIVDFLLNSSGYKNIKKPPLQVEISGFATDPKVR